MAERTTINAMAGAIAAFDPNSLSPALIEQAKLLLLDTLGCAIAGRNEPTSLEVQKSALSLGGAEQASLIGSGTKTSFLNAILINGVIMRVLDLNDYTIAQEKGEPAMGGHPSDNIPVALAAGEWQGKSGYDVLATIVLGYELYNRFKKVITRADQFDGTSISGIVAAAMTGHIMGQGAEPLSHALAFGAARCMAPPLMRRGQISSAKSLSNALTAQSGALSALLASNGATGPVAVLDEVQGIRRMFVDDADMASLSAPLTNPGAILETHVKAFPSVATSQAAIGAAIQLHGDGLNTANIDTIEMIMADTSYMRGHQTDPGRSNPKSRHAADHCFPFLVAAALSDGELTPRSFDNQRWETLEIKSLMSKITMGVDGTLNTLAPDSYPCRLTVTTKDGAQFEAQVLYPPGFSKGHINAPDVIAKFAAVTKPTSSETLCAEIQDTVMALDRAPSLDVLMASLAQVGDG
ncbi:MAG: MmgE/PrpD family protein [Rhodospirillales bacterium]|jgi:2-methylcitrate dehydratase|nr:MmgE/PrpD family protein [Rhodospirillales bacterium]MBT4005779.1 MmgE/PrpD family protein [Rhodospirillales bacterium]MBT5114064.1 MmgE/PrpD family protein [Rhodospirillales bacterium]MBT5672592.1 MmgE/PrpD family protein [Rhodospirillales bacterium]MBT6185738.1 MmgE/PrpD family protein [Rhodospirillales bacterium]